MGNILKAGKNYTFSDYFNLNHPTKEIMAEFGYCYSFAALELPKSSKALNSLDRLRDTYIRKLPFISLTSEAAKREFYIAPLLLEILDYIQIDINVEYPLEAGENLSGTLDYLLKSMNSFVIIEAKEGDLEKGFNQLAVELIALDKTLEIPQQYLYGVVTLGDLWRFALLERNEKKLQKDMNVYRLPADLEELFLVLLGILEKTS
jgi:hypothetical protein